MGKRHDGAADLAGLIAMQAEIDRTFEAGGMVDDDPLWDAAQDVDAAILAARPADAAGMAMQIRALAAAPERLLDCEEAVAALGAIADRLEEMD